MPKEHGIDMKLAKSHRLRAATFRVTCCHLSSPRDPNYVDVAQNSEGLKPLQLESCQQIISPIMSAIKEKHYGNAEVIRKNIFEMYKEMVDAIRFVFHPL